MRKLFVRLIGYGSVLFASAMAVASTELPQYAQDEHIGVATCASGVCHGSVRGRDATSVLQNEYVVWSRMDRHRIAYQTLLTPESKNIATKLGIGKAHEAKICLDCHADNVAIEKRGEKFQIEDGVGCEACHGGAQRYISSHVDVDSNHSANLSAGLYPTDQPKERAELCLSCHLGNGEKMATHDIMGAGHPRISFELDTFGALQPPHYVVDDDYKAEKWHGSQIDLWAIGQVTAAKQTLALIDDRLEQGGLFPEIALFDCHACHHSMSEKRWVASERSALPPGAVRLNDANFVILLAIAEVMADGSDVALTSELKTLHLAVNNNGNYSASIAALTATLEKVHNKLASMDFSNSAEELIEAMIRGTIAGNLTDYVVAEQAIMAIDMLLEYRGVREDYSQWLDQVYSTLQDEDNFSPEAYIDSMRRFGA
ncbi:MAG: multiheme c-type cytochrome [Pseudomonadales bacterium]|nr:multiheme c-type cytochrome [Pseudomonadales bacterium]MDG1444322.1 multiheme c-type cytochrome [Pseudomonadales bacterium]